MSRPSTHRAAPTRAVRCWTLVGEAGAIDVEVEALDSDTLGGVLPALADELGVPVEGLWEGGGRLPDDLPLTARALEHGAVLGLGRPAPPAWRSMRGSALELHVVGGPDAGRAFPLDQGRHVLGRSGEATLPLRDPDISREHVAVDVGSGRITVADLGSTNGSRIEGEDIGLEPRPWPVGARVRLGTTALTVAAAVHGGASVMSGSGGRALLRTTPRLRPPVPEIEIALPRPPAPPPVRRLPWVPVALPAVGGVLMAWLLAAPPFLFFALLSPVVAVGTWLSDRWTGRRTGRRETTAHARRLLETERRLGEAVVAFRRAAESAHPDLATLTTAARRRTGLLWSRSGADPDAMTVRLGTGPGRTGVVRIDADGTRETQTAGDLPVVADLRRDGGLAVVGPQACSDGVLAAVLAQVTGLHSPEVLDLQLLVDSSRLASWQWARWLPHLRPSSVHTHGLGPPGGDSDVLLLSSLTDLVARRTAASGGVHGGSVGPPNRWTIVVVDRPLDPRLVAVLRDARDMGVLVLTAAPSLSELPVPVEASFRLVGETGDGGLLSRPGIADQSLDSVDRLPSSPAARFARGQAGLAPADASNSLPRSVRLVELAGTGLRIDATGDIAGTWSSTRRRLDALLGRTAEGPVAVDLCHEGPHALVAGTTGSGKSELLQTLVTSLALHHPPERCSFLLVDYKGGAAFAEAAALPHTVGVVTDLDGQTTARALRSLDAELARRESILARSRVADLADLPGDVDLARLVIVVDEFATLADELPAFVPGLVSIAQRGRSLGVHLVLATQRPSGIVSPEIRANCSLRICLRTTDEGDSRDVLGTPSAAHLPVDRPGRAYLRPGSAPPRLFQVARVASAADPSTDPRPAVRRWTWPVPAARPAETSAGRSDLSRLSTAIAGHALTTSARSPHRPWQPPLPDRLAPAEQGDSTRSGSLLRIGLVDLPDAQSRRPLELDLADGGTWLAVGGPRSGRTTLLRTVLQEAVAQLGPDELHVHVIESSGGALAAEAHDLPHTGTVTGDDDRLRTVRLVQRLAEEVAVRRADPTASGRPALLLLVDGVEELVTLLEDAEPGVGSALLARLLRDGAAAGLTCVGTADRAVPGGRLAALSRHRLVLPLADRADYAVAGVPSRAVPEHRPPGRALYGEDALECQLAVPRSAGSPRTARTIPGQPPLSIPALPADPVLPSRSDGPVPDGPADRLLLVVGPGGDEGGPLSVDVARTGGLLVAGPPGSGRSTALDAFARQLHDRGVPLLRLGSRGESTLSAWTESSDVAGVRDWIQTLDGGPAVVVVDDVGTPGECPALDALVPRGESQRRIAVLAAGQPASLAGHYQGPLALVRRARTGLLLCPGPGDADLLGVRLPRTPVPVRPGSGWLVTTGTAQRVQVARPAPEPRRQ